MHMLVLLSFFLWVFFSLPPDLRHSTLMESYNIALYWGLRMVCNHRRYTNVHFAPSCKCLVFCLLFLVLMGCLQYVADGIKASRSTDCDCR